MSFEITTAQKVQFGQNYYHLAQQKMSRLRNAVMVDIPVGGLAEVQRGHVSGELRR